MNAWKQAGIGVVLASTLGCAARSGPVDGTLVFRTPDGFTLEADLRVPSGDPGPGRERAPLVLLAHDLEADRRAWDPLAPLLVGHGWAALALDLRGFGGSTAEAASPAELDGVARRNLHLDLLAALDAAGKDGRVDTSRVVVVAAGLSVTPAVRVAIERSSVRGVALVSGLIEETEEIHLREHPDFPVLLVASAGDERGRNLMRQYAARLTGPGQDYLELPAGDPPGWRGTDGLAAESGLIEHLLWFIERTFGSAVDAAGGGSADPPAARPDEKKR